MLRTPRHGSSAAFTLLELLIVITIIALLALMTLGAAVSLREKARIASTSARMQNVMNGLATYSSSERSTAFALQSALNLGGVLTFDPFKVINDNLTPTYPAAAGRIPHLPEEFVLVNNGGGKIALNLINYMDPDPSNPNGMKGEGLSLWRRLIENVTDVEPLSTSWATADYSDPTKGGWPTQWPETDWDASTPGTVPPILRFPWGKPGLRADGTLCDPAVATGPAGSKFTEATTFAGYHYAVSENLQNAWATTGNSIGGARIWQWTSSDTAQTDSVHLDQAFRSDTGAIASVSSASTNANVAMPFDAGWMSPLATVGFLTAAGVLTSDTGAADYRSNRKPSSPWNDAWGHPLVVVYAMFQPERYTRRFDDSNRRDLLLKAALRAYQYNRSLYIAVGAVGPTKLSTLPDTWAATADATTLRDYWLHIRTTTRAAEWTESSFAAPPKAWNGGVRVNDLKPYKGMLTAVRELQ